jgi:hypothetical protein
MLFTCPALPVAPSILHSRQTRILLAIQEMKRQGRRAISLRSHNTKKYKEITADLGERHSISHR